MPASAAIARIFFSGPIRIGAMRSRSAASMAPFSASLLHGWTTAVVSGGSPSHILMSCR